MKLTKKQKEAMRLVKNGADVIGLDIAMELRALQKRHPELISITKRMGKYKASQQLPYFGAILTDAGRRVRGGLHKGQ